MQYGMNPVYEYTKGLEENIGDYLVQKQVLELQ